MATYIDKSQVMRVGVDFALLCVELSKELDKTYPEITQKIATELRDEITKIMRKAN